MHATQSAASHVGAEQVAHVASCLAIVYLCFSFRIHHFLFVFTGDKYGAAVFEVLFNPEKVDFLGFLHFNIVAFVVVQQQNLKDRGFAAFFCDKCFQKMCFLRFVRAVLCVF